jgi:hypothetical protein
MNIRSVAKCSRSFYTGDMQKFTPGKINFLHVVRVTKPSVRKQT